ncbi:MAG TPA: c-type cytochrome domain-containing protein [Planctomycetaceae bacterium]
MSSASGLLKKGIMKQHWIVTLAVVLAACASNVSPGQAEDEKPVPDKPAAVAVAYDQVRPVFQKRCVTCHDEGRNKGGLDLSTLEGIKAGGVSGPAVVSGNPDESSIYLLTAHLETPRMPPNNPKIPQREIDLIRRWIEGGLVDRGTTVAKTATAAPAPLPATKAAVAKTSPQTSAAVTGLVAIDPLMRPTAITALAVNPKTPLVAVSGHKQIALFRWTDRSPLKAFAFPEGDVFALRFSRDGELLVAGGGVGGLSGRVVGFEVATGKRLFELGEERDVVLAVDISADKSLVALGGPGRTVKVFRTADGELTATLRKHTDWILSLAFSPEGLLLASGDRFGGLQVWEARSGKEFHTLRGHAGAVNALAWSADSERLLSAGQDDSLRFWNMHDGAQSARWNAGVGGILAVDCDAAGRVVCGGRKRKLSVWEKPEVGGQQMSMPDEVVKLAVSHDSSHVIAGDAAGNVAVFAMANGELAGNLSLPLAPKISTARTPPPAINELRRTRQKLAGQPADAAAAEAAARQAASELAEVRDALAAAESAVKSTEESLQQLRQSAAKLAALVSTREAAAKQTAKKAAELRSSETDSDSARK